MMSNRWVPSNWEVESIGKILEKFPNINVLDF